MIKRIKNITKLKKRRGQILIFFLTLMAVGLLLSTSLLALQAGVYRNAKRTSQTKDVTYLAEAGLDYGIQNLNDTGAVVENEAAIGNGTYIVRDLSGSGSERTLESTGYFPNATNPIVTKKVRAKVKLSTTSVQFFYGVQVDSGGLTMGNNSSITGNIFSNGSISGGNGSTITGDAIVAGGLDATPAVEWTTHDADQFFATASTNRDIAQSFTANETGSVPKLSVYLGKVGNPTNNITLRLTTEVSGQPDTSSLATATIPYTSVGTTPSWIDVSFSSPPGLTNNTRYWIVLDYGSNSTTDYWNWRKDSTDGYASNTGKYTSNCCSGSPTWTDVGGDLAFRVWIGGTNTNTTGLTIGNSTSGTGKANEFINTTIHGSACPNQYCIVENPARQNLPISDGVIQDWKNDAAAGGAQTGDYTLINGGSASLGPKKIQGNMVIDNNATLTIAGTVWVTGDITFSNNCLIRLASTYGSNSGIIIADGKVNVSNNCTFQGSGTAGSYIILMTAKDSILEEIMTIDNGSTGVIYYAGKGRIKFSNNASAKEATAYGITLDNNAVITYDSGLANANFSSGPGASWILQKGTVQEY